MLNNSNENNGLALEYNAILNSESVYVWLVSLCDEEFSVTRKSRGIEKIFKDEKSIDETLISTFDHQYREALKTGKNVLRKMFKVNDEYININFDPVVRDGKASEVVAVADITTREKVLIGENKDIALEYESLFQTTLNAMLILRKEDEKYIIERANDVFCNFRDIIPGSEVGVPLDDIYDEKDASRIKVNIDESIKNKKPISYRFTTKLGQFNVFVTPVIIKDEVKKVITTIVDETEERNKNEEIEFISYHDSLTGLYNRRYIDQYLEKLTREKKTNISAVMFDIDGLKLINDTFGNVEGDKLIKKAAETIKTVFDKCVVARWGGDEFVAIGLDLDYSYYAERMAKLEDIVFSVAEEDIKLSISIGYAVFDENTADAYAIIKSAEESMYSQKFLNNDNLRNNYLELLKQMLFEKTMSRKTTLTI
ncbi:MAG: GGDEF domain-containing protein [Oscillospiraceae bacterium]|nr:GGDEF domain-containing protein [Oscillospiraceae bacterium]